MRLTFGEVLAATNGRALNAPAPDAVFEAVSTDTRTIAGGSLFVALKGDRFDGHDYLEKARDNGASGAIFSHGELPKGLAGIKVDDTLVALGALANFARNKCKFKVLAITGSFGKTTTKEMCAAMLESAGARVLKTKGNLNNLIGLPLTILGARGDEEYAVLELGISLVGEMEKLSAIAEPDVALVTGVGPAHTEGLSSVEGIAREKLKIAASLKKGGTLLLPFGDALLKAPQGVAVKTFGWDEKADFAGSQYSAKGENGGEFVVDGKAVAVPLPGFFNAKNALAGYSLAKTAGVDPVVEALVGMQKMKLRSEIRKGSRGESLLVDCYNSNPPAVEAAMETLASLAQNSRKLAVIGEMRELGELSTAAHQRIGKRAVEAGIAKIYFFGEATSAAKASAQEAGLSEGSSKVYGDLETLTRDIQNDIKPGDWVLIKGSRTMGLERVADALTARDTANAL